MKKYYEDYEDKDPGYIGCSRRVSVHLFRESCFCTTGIIGAGDLSQILLRENPPDSLRSAVEKEDDATMSAYIRFPAFIEVCMRKVKI